MLCGTFGAHAQHLRYIEQVIGLRPGVSNFAAMNVLMLPKRMVFICDTYVTADPNAEHIAEMTDSRRRGGAPLRHDAQGGAAVAVELRLAIPSRRRQKMRRALAILNERAPELEVEGEMHGDAALSEEIRLKVFPDSRLNGEANLLIMPTLDASNIAFNLLKTASGDGVTIGPILLGAARPCTSSRRRRRCAASST